MSAPITLATPSMWTIGDITTTDLFCGAGGSGLGAAAVPGINLVMAVNHSKIAILTHQLNFPHTDHDVADISQIDPRRYPRTTILWASPECTNHSIAKGRKQSAQTDLFTPPDPLAERSRATMWDVPRFAEVHRYQAVIVENVVDVARWSMFPAWLMAMRALGYAHRIAWLNSMHAPAMATPRAPQSRDRAYIVFWREGNRAPDLEIRPDALCPDCGPVHAMQSWKRPDRPRWGRYRAQYVYRCPTPGCHLVIEPAVLPAAAAIDWDLPGRRIGDRARPLEPATLARINAGLARYARPLVVPAGGTWNSAAAPVTEPLRTRTTRETEALVVPYYRTGVAHDARHPMPTVTTRDRVGLAFIAELRGGGSSARTVTEPLATVCASGRHHALIRDTDPGTGPVSTDPAAPLQEVPAREVRAEDCTFRMLAVHEIAAGMAFTPRYVLKGTKRDQVRQLGNAVTPPAAEWLYRAVAASLGADVKEAT